MSQYNNELKFALFENDKGGNDKRPDRRGTATVNGVVYKMSAWIAHDKSGRRYLRGVMEVDQKAMPPPAPAASYGTYEPPGRSVTVPGGAAPVQRDLTGAAMTPDEEVPF